MSKDVSDYQNLLSEGLEAVNDNKKVMIVSPVYIRSQYLPFDLEDYESLAHEGKTVLFVLDDEKLIGYIALSDIVS